MKILLLYPNLPLMMSPAMSIGIFNSIAKRMGCEICLFETTQYSEQYSNRHIRMSEIGANRPNKEDELRDMFWIKDPKTLISDFVKTVNDFQPDLILASVQEDVWKMTTLLFDSIADKNIMHILGGQFPTNAPEIVISHKSIKCLARHEGELTVIEAINAIKNKTSLNDVKGLWIKDSNGVVKKTPPQQLCNINDVTPDYSCFEDIRWRRPMGGKVFKRAISMETFRGCPYNCTYCNSPTTRLLAKEFQLGNFMRRKTIDTIERELNHYVNRYNPDLIMIIDDSFLARPAKEIFEFCKMWEKYKIPFWFNTRIENCNHEYLAALKAAGVYRMSFGIESGNEEYRKSILKRQITNDTYYKFLNYINNSNIPYSLNVIIGMPFETRSMVLDTAEMIHNARGYDSLTISMFQPYWGTELRKIAVENNFLPHNYINNWRHSGSDGGYLDSWALTMPLPYLQPNDVYNLVKTFSLYAYYDKSEWGKIYASESDNNLYEDLMKKYQKEFFNDSQKGGLDRIQLLNKACAVHDGTSTYHFNEVIQ